MLESVNRSPCNSICNLKADGHCEGCYRTIEEIAGWSVMSEDDRSRVLKVIAVRRGKLK